MDFNLCDQKLNDSQSLIKFLSEFIGKLKASSQTPQHGQFIRKLETLYEVANSQNLKPELIIKIENILKQLKEKYDSKTREEVEQECLNYKASDAKSMPDNPYRSRSLLEFLTEPFDQVMKGKKDKSDKYSDNRRHRKHRRHNIKSHRSKKCERSKRRDRFERDRQSHSVSPERSRHGQSERHHYKKSDKYRSSHDNGEEEYDRFKNGGNYSTPLKYRTNHTSANDSQLENKYECSDRNSPVCRRDNNELMVNPFNDRRNSVFNAIDRTVQSNDAKLTEFKASELTPRHLKMFGCAAERKVSLTSHIPETELKYELSLLKQDSTSKQCASTLVSEADVEDSAILSFAKTFIDTTSKSTSKHHDTCIKSKCSKSVDDDIIDKIVTETTDVKNDVTSLKPKGDSSIEVRDVAVTSDRKSMNEVTDSNNLQYIRPTDPRLRLREQRLKEERNSSLFYSKPIASIPSYPPVIQSKPANRIYVRHGQPHPYPSNMTSQCAMPSYPIPLMNIPIPLMNIPIPYSPTYEGHNRKSTTPMTYGEYKQSKAASEKLKNKIVMNTFSTDISKSRLDNVYRSGTFSNTLKKKTHYAANIHNSNTTESDWDDSNEIARGNSRRVVNSDIEASQIRDQPSESSSTEKQNDSVTNLTSLLTDNQPSVISEVLKQLLNPNMLPALLNACGHALDDNMISRLKDSIQNWNEANQPGKCIQNPPTEVVQTVAPKTPRKNELEKLYEDIHNGALYATGRRMSAVSSNAKKESVATVSLKTKKHENQSRDDSTIANKRLVPLNGTQKVRRRMSCFADLPKKCTQPSPLPKEKKSAGATFQKPKITKRTSEGTKKATKSTKTIYLGGNMNKIAKRLTRQCSIVLKKLHPLASVEMLSGIVNPKKDGVFPSRVLPEVADFLRDSKELHKVELVSTEPFTCYEFKQRCYFCNETKSLTKMGWLHHISVHTGYTQTQYKCTDCKKRFSTPVKLHVCNTTVKVRSNLIKESLPQYTKRDFFGYLCDLCNFVRFEKGEIQKHLRCEHGAYARANVTMKFKKIILLSFPKYKCEVKSNVDERIETRPRKRSMSVANLDNDDRELHSTKKVIRSHVVQSKVFIAEPNEDNGFVKRGKKKIKKDTFFSSRKDARCSSISNRKKSVAEKRNEKFHSVNDHHRYKIRSNDKKRSETRSFDRLSSNDGAPDGINTQIEDEYLIELKNVGETLKEEKSPATTTHIKKYNGTPTEETFEESDENEAEIPKSRLSNNNTVGVIDTTEHATQQSISSQDPVSQLYIVDKAMSQTEGKLSINKEKDSEGQMEGSVFIKCEVLEGDDLSHMNEAEAFANGKQCSIQDSDLLTQLTTTDSKPEISTFGTLNAQSLPANGRDDSTVVSLKQWLNIPTFKLQKHCKTMLRDISMFALYKCMDYTCAFTTNDTELMLIHLRNHENHEINNQIAIGSPSWLECPYCNEIGDSCLLLLEHIQHEHQSSIFQCPYCFYRSCTDYNVMVHLSQFHPFEQKSILVCHGNPKEYATEKNFIEKSRREFIRPLRCTDDCGEITFVMDHFVQHMKNSPAHTDKFRCQVCRCHISISSAAKHLLCHRIGVLECVYCQYGTNGIESIQNHMCNIHPSKLPYICVRLMKSQVLTDEQLRSVESTLSVHLCLSVDPKLFRRCPYTEQQLNFLSPSIELTSILSESQVPAPVPLKELTSSSLPPIDTSSETSTNETLGSSSSHLVVSGIISYENFKRVYVSDDYDEYFASQSNIISPM